MRSLYEAFEKSASGPLYWPELSKLESDLDDVASGKLFPVSFNFPAFFVAQINTTYWSSMMAVHHEIMYSYNKLTALELPKSPDSKAGSPQATSAETGDGLALSYQARALQHDAIWKAMIWNVCQSVEYHLQDKMGWPGLAGLLPPLTGAKSCLESVHPEDWSREIAFITEAMGKIVQRFNFPVTRVFEA